MHLLQLVLKILSDLSGSSIYIKDITEFSELQQKNFLNFIRKWFIKIYFLNGF